MPARFTNAAARSSDQTTSQQFEPFVDAARAAEFLCCSRKQLLNLARSATIPAYTQKTGNQRRTWLFRLSELEAYVLASARRLPNSKDELEAE
jgi:hypothetical protein